MLEMGVILLAIGSLLLLMMVLLVFGMVVDVRRRVSELENQTFDDPQLAAWNAQCREPEGKTP